jgi:hypothetical protein
MAQHWPALVVSIFFCQLSPATGSSYVVSCTYWHSPVVGSGGGGSGGCQVGGVVLPEVKFFPYDIVANGASSQYDVGVFW